MKKLMIALLPSFIWLAYSCQMTGRPPETSGERAELLLSKMTLEEKIGQMTQVTIDLVLKDNSTNEIDQQKLRTAILDRKVGSILNVKWHGYPLDKWHEIINEIQKVAIKETEKGIPILYGIDAIHGMNYALESTLFPHNIGLAASRNPDLVWKAAKVTAMETRAAGIRWNFDPALGLGRQPLWSRFEETFGEDSYLASVLGATMIHAYEGDGLSEFKSVASCAKHFLAYSAPRSGKDRTPSYLPEQEIREYYLPPFAQAIKAGTSTVMINSGELNGIPLHADKKWLIGVLRKELGFDGVIVSDWEDIIRLHTRHHVAKNRKEAVRMGIEAGIDMSMVPYDYSFYNLLLELVREGSISEKRIDESVKRILRLKFDLGLFTDPFVEKEAMDQFGSDTYEQLALDAARESITLLKNKNGLLPIDQDVKLLVVGPTAHNKPALHGSWSYTWQGQNHQYYPTDVPSIQEGLIKRFGTANIITQSSTDFQQDINYNKSLLIANAQNADYIILCLGENAYAESPGLLNDLTLEERQIALAKTAISTGKPVIMVLAQGRPRIIEAIESGIDAIIQLYRPGNQGANALAEIIAGEINPSGILPFSYPRYSGDLLTYDHKNSEKIREISPGQYDLKGYNPQWPFGHGLSYSHFDVSNVQISHSHFSKKDTVTITLEVTNNGPYQGKKTIELYSSDLFASSSPNNKRLRRFKKVNLKVNETKKVVFKLTAQDLSFVDRAGRRVVEPGRFDLSIESFKQTIIYQK